MSINEIPAIERLAGKPAIESDRRTMLESDYLAALRGWWPAPFGDYFRERYKIDLTAQYAGRTIPHPFGKGSGQLSMTTGQIRESAEAGLAFVVLKTVIGEDSFGQRSMGDWATDDTRMVVEPITGRSNRTGWTVSWKGRGWGRSFQDYLDLCRESFELMAETGMVIAPSAKMHLPQSSEEPWRIAEYDHVISRLAEVWERAGTGGPMPFEKDFSPTLAGDDRSKSEGHILRWLDQIVPNLRGAAPGRVRIGLKLMNAVGSLELQHRIFGTTLRLAGEHKPDFLVYANRLFDPERLFETHRGIAYGGPDLSDRNIAMLRAHHDSINAAGLEISATGDVDSGRAAVEYALNGCGSAQLHTLFQVPLRFPVEVKVGRIRKVLARLIFDPDEGLIAWLEHARRHWGLADLQGVACWNELPNLKIPKARFEKDFQIRSPQCGH